MFDGMRRQRGAMWTGRAPLQGQRAAGMWGWVGAGAVAPWGLGWGGWCGGALGVGGGPSAVAP